MNLNNNNEQTIFYDHTETPNIKQNGFTGNAKPGENKQNKRLIHQLLPI
jgi:hypothetical protein